MSKVVKAKKANNAVNYVTAKNLYANDLKTPHPPLTAAVVKKSRKEIGRMRESLAEILDLAEKGARDLLGGDPWSENIDRFESLSMDQARVLARFPVRTNHPKLGRQMLKARETFVAFRESVRWKIIGKIFSDTTKPAYNKAIELITAEAALASRNLEKVEKALASV